MKNLILLTALAFSLNFNASATNPITNQKALKTFNEIFKTAENVTWNITANYNEASFNIAAVKTKAMFDNDGKLVRTIRYYKEQLLPSHILYRLKKKFATEEIWGITEVADNNGTTYTIVLKSEKYWYNIKVDSDANFDLISKLKRGDK